MAYYRGGNGEMERSKPFKVYLEVDLKGLDVLVMRDE